MREQSVYQQLRSHLAYLRLSAAAEQLPAALEAAERSKLSHTRFLEQLLAAEVEATERRRLNGRIRFASFPTQITLADIDYDAQPGLDRQLVNELTTRDHEVAVGGMHHFVRRDARMCVPESTGHHAGE